MNKKCFLGLCLLATLPLCAMHDKEKTPQARVLGSVLEDRSDVRACTLACANRLMRRGKRRPGTFTKREKIYDTVDYGDFAVTVWDGGNQQ